MAVTQRRSGRVGFLQRLASAAVLGYVRRFPFERGKYRLMQAATSFLVAPLEPGVYLRVTELNWVEVRVIRDGRYERGTTEVFASLLAPGMTVLDVGANVGAYALVAADRVGERGGVHCFEPGADAAACLRRNVALNGFDNVVVNEVAASDAPGEAVLYIDTDAPVENSIVASNAGCAAPTVRVPTVTLDGYVAERGLARVDLIKMDIEGAETLGLRGAAGLLAADDAPLLLLELNPKALKRGGSSPEELLGLLRQHGYTYHPVATYNAEAEPYSNGIAAKPSHWDRFPALARWVGRPECVPVS
jgi:FkbM family methyltransferase